MKIWINPLPIIFSVSGHDTNGRDLQTEVIKAYQREIERGLGDDQRKKSNCDKSELPEVDDG